jgi:hypothetical protein
VTSAKVRNGSLREQDFANGQLGPRAAQGDVGPQGAQGLKGVQGIQGLTGPPGTAVKFVADPAQVSKSTAGECVTLGTGSSMTVEVGSAGLIAVYAEATMSDTLAGTSNDASVLLYEPTDRPPARRSCSRRVTPRRPPHGAGQRVWDHRARHVGSDDRHAGHPHLLPPIFEEQHQHADRRDLQQPPAMGDAALASRRVASLAPRRGKPLNLSGLP